MTRKRGGKGQGGHFGSVRLEEGQETTWRESGPEKSPLTRGGNFAGGTRKKKITRGKR